MDETSEEITGAVTREAKPERQRDVNPLPTEREAIKIAKVLAKKASLRGKVSYVTKLINDMTKQVSENGEPKQVDFNTQSLKKAMISFRDFNDGYVELLEDSQQIEEIFKTFFSMEDNFQQCIEAAESYLAECKKESRSNRSSRKSGKFSISVFSARNDRHKAQDSLEIEIKHGASTNVKIETTENQEWQNKRIPTQAARAPEDQKFVAEDTILRHTFNPLTRAPLQTPIIPDRHIFPTIQTNSLFPYPHNVTSPNPPPPPFPNILSPSPEIAKQASIEPTRRQADSQSDKNMPSMMGLTQKATIQLPLGGENIVPLGKFIGRKECWPRFSQTFKAVVDKQPYEPISKLAILEQHIIGQAKDCIKGFSFDEKSYPFVLKTLEGRFCGEDDHAAFHLGAIEDLPRVKEKETYSLRKFYDDLQAHIQILEAQGPDVACHLCDPRRL